MNDCTFEIVKHIATLSKNEAEVSKQVNLISWNGKPAAIDIRAWNSRGKPYKGISLTIEEANVLKEALETLKD